MKPHPKLAEKLRQAAKILKGKADRDLKNHTFNQNDDAFSHAYLHVAEWLEDPRLSLVD